MKCYLCGTPLNISSNIDFPEHELYNMISFFDCPKCNAAVEVYHPIDQRASTSCQCSIR